MTDTQSSDPRVIGTAARRSRRESLKPVVALLGPHRRLMKWTVGYGLAYEGLTVAAAGISAYLVGRAITGTTGGTLLPWIIMLTVLVLLITLCQALEDFYAHKMSFYAHDDIRQSLFDAFERLAPAFFVRRRSGDVATSATSDVELIELYTSHHLPTRVVATVVPLFAAVGLLALHPVLFATLLPFLILLATVPGWLRVRAQVHGTEILDRGAWLSADLVDSVQGLRDVIAFGAEQYQLTRINANADALGAARIAHGRRAGFEKAVSDGLVSLGLLAVVGVAAFLVSSGSLSGTAYPPAVVLAAAAFIPLAKVTSVGRELNRVAAASDRITSLLHEPAEVTDSIEVHRAESLRPVVRFEHVGFRYDAASPEVLHDISFHIDEGETLALVGHSGAGKSSCANLLLRLWDTTSGSVRIGDVDLRHLPLAQLPELVAHVPQDVYLFNGNVLDNIRIGHPEASDKDVERAVHIAAATEFIEALPQGYHTQLGERGTRLSGGQRQRLAIARAILSSAPILVMDEAVSNLDAESEVAIHQAITNLGGRRTMMIIAHRQSTIKHADRIVVLSGGRVVETGRYVELMPADGPFSKLIRQGLDHLDQERRA